MLADSQGQRSSWISSPSVHLQTNQEGGIPRGIPRSPCGGVVFASQTWDVLFPPTVLNTFFFLIPT